MQVVKIVFVLAMAMAIFVLVSCVGNRVTAEDARNVDPTMYGDLEKAQDGYELERLMIDCGGVAAFQPDGCNILAEIGTWEVQVHTYRVESGLEEPFWCSEVFVSREGKHYAFGHIEGSMPVVTSQPERVLVQDTNARPWRQRVEKATLEDLIELLTSGQLLENQNDPLEGLSFSYIETDASGVTREHRPDGSEPREVTGVSAVPPSGKSNSE